MISKFDIPAGTTLTRQLLDIPHDVERGDTLTVISAIGRARVEAECIADQSGRAGSIIAVHNARSGRRFRVLIQAKGRAVVASSDALGLIAEDLRR
jgi:flagella basal body P-ring formation protein FlgA